jgi:hypothetical protein
MNAPLVSTFLGMTAATWAAIGSVGAAIVYLVLGGIALSQLSEARKARQDQIRPYVIVDFTFRQWLIYISIRNVGKSPAYNVRVTFDKPLESTIESRANINDFAAIAKPIPMLAPGRDIRVFFDSSFARLADDSSLPLAYTASVAYTNGKGKVQKDPPCHLDLAAYNETAVEFDYLEKLAKETEEIRKELHKWTDGISGVKVNASDRVRLERKKLRGYGMHNIRIARQQGGRIAAVKAFWANRRWLL